MIFRHIVYDAPFSFVTIYNVGKCRIPSVLKICSDFKSRLVFHALGVKKFRKDLCSCLLLTSTCHSHCWEWHLYEYINVCWHFPLNNKINTHTLMTDVRNQQFRKHLIIARWICLHKLCNSQQSLVTSQSQVYLYSTLYNRLLFRQWNL